MVASERLAAVARTESCWSGAACGRTVGRGRVAGRALIWETRIVKERDRHVRQQQQRRPPRARASTRAITLGLGIERVTLALGLGP